MRVLSKVVLAACGLTLTSLAQAAPWVKTEDQFLQQSIQLLANAGLVKTPVNTWPLMWQPLLQDLANIDTQSLTDAQLHAYLRVSSAASFSQQARINSLAFSGSNETLGQRGFGYQYQQEAQVSLGVEFKDNNWTAAVYKQFRQSAYDANSFSENETHWDGSYGAYTAGNWVLFAAVQQQWWGPAIHSSFNFNNQQRPAKSIQISRLNPNMPLHNSLRSLGALQLNIQYGEYAGTAPTRHANYMAARVGLKPFSAVEVGLTARKLQPKPEQQNPTEPFFNLLPSDDLNNFGLDIRYHLNTQTALYGEYSNQSGGGQGSAWLAGAQYHIGNQFVLLRFYTEFQKIAEDYNQWLFIHPGDQHGALESEWVAGVQISTPSGKSGYLKFTKTSSYSTNEQSEQLIDPAGIHAGYQQPLFGGLIGLDYQLQRSKVMAEDNRFDHAIGARWEWRW